jgi:hypothetical protein
VNIVNASEDDRSMSRVAWVTAVIIGATVGLACAALMREAGYAMCAMATLAAWFIANDVWLDNKHQRDNERAELERQDWDTYRP